MAPLISRSGAQHAGLAFPEVGFHNTGLYNEDGKGAYRTDNHGILEVTSDAADEGEFRTPSLRNTALTAHYMHDGSIAVAFLESLTDNISWPTQGSRIRSRPPPLIWTQGNKRKCNSELWVHVTADHARTCISLFRQN